MLPGGNDALVLYGIPSFSPHALPAYAALIVGVAVGLLIVKHLIGLDTRVVCSNDIYRAEVQPCGSVLNSTQSRRWILGRATLRRAASAVVRWKKSSCTGLEILHRNVSDGRHKDWRPAAWSERLMRDRNEIINDSLQS